MSSCRLLLRTRDTPPRSRHSRKAIQRKTGARGLRSILESILLDTMFELPGMGGVQEAVVSADVVEGRAKPLLIYAEGGRNGQQSAG